jgi:hypothetical protein
MPEKSNTGLRQLQGTTLEINIGNLWKFTIFYMVTWMVCKIV